jgi:hypothetical protein
MAGIIIIGSMLLKWNSTHDVIQSQQSGHWAPRTPHSLFRRQSYCISQDQLTSHWTYIPHAISFLTGCTRCNFMVNSKLHGLSPQAKYTDRLSDRRLSAKLVPTLADIGCRVVSAMVPPQSFNFGFLDRSRSSIIITRLSGPRSRPTTSQKKLGSAWNRTRTCVSVARNFDH